MTDEPGFTSEAYPRTKPNGGAGKMEPLFDPWARSAVPAFPFKVLPEVLQEFIAGNAIVIGCDPSALAMATLGALSGAIDHRSSVKMMKHGDWWAHPRLWVLLSGDPSTKKSPIIKCATKPLEQREGALRRDYEARMRDYERDVADAKECKEKCETEEPARPPRHVVSDTTIEKLGEILSDNDRGVLVKADELTGWLGRMERYSTASAGADRAFWLQAYDGGYYAVDRVKRGEIHIRNLSVSIIAGIQPDRLAELKGLTSDGLLQRFVPIIVAPSTFERDVINNNQDYAALVHRLIEAEHRRFFFTNDALAAMAHQREELHELLQASGGMAKGFQAFIGKLGGVAGSLTLILHLVADPQGTSNQILAHTVEGVRQIVDFTLRHGFEFYRSTETMSDGDRLQKTASWIVTCGKQRIVASDLTTNVSHLRGLGIVDLNRQMSPFVANDWLAPTDKTPVCRAWTVSPNVATQFAERAKIEDMRKAQIAKAMGSPRKQHQ